MLLDQGDSRMKVQIKVWPSDAPSYSTEWTMPQDVLDDKGVKSLLHSFLRAQGLELRECTAELTVDSQVIVAVRHQLKMVKTTRMCPR